jgi:hypothetical protein
MSINTLANAAAARRSDMAPLDTVPKGLDEIARVSATPPTTNPQSQAGAVPGKNATQIETTFNVLFGYIPTEILTLYVAVVAAIHQPNNTTSADWITFIIFLVATPIVVWLVYGAKVKASENRMAFAWAVLPLWEMIAATIAYSAWAFALPNNPFTALSWYSAGLSGVVVLAASTVLGLLSPFFQRPLQATPKPQSSPVMPS